LKSSQIQENKINQSKLQDKNIFGDDHNATNKQSGLTDIFSNPSKTSTNDLTKVKNKF
jgi:hypothetical protein